MSTPSVSITIDKNDIARIKSDFLLMEGEVPVALSRAINRTLTAVNTAGSVQVRKHYNLKASRVKKNFSVKKATKSYLNASWKSQGEPIGLINFGARQNKKGVSVKVTASGSRETVNTAFIQVGKNKVQHVFWREKVGGVRVGRYDIERLTGPRIEDALAKDSVQKALQQTADETLKKRLDAEANYILSKAKG